MTIGDMLGGGARLVRTQPRAVALWAGLYLVAAAAMMALTWPMLGDLADFQRQAIAAQATAAPPPAPPEGVFGAILFIDFVLLFVLAAIFAAAVRASARGGTDRYGFLRAGQDELRLIGLGLLLGLIGFAAGIGFGLAAALIAGLLYAAFGQGALIAIVPLWLAGMALAIWAQVRISLAGALTVLNGRIVVRAAWRATRGRFWTLFGGYLLIGIAYCAASLAMIAILYPELFGVYAAMWRGDPDPAALVAGMFGRLFGARMLVGAAIGAVVNTVLVAWLFGAVATAALALDDARPAAAA